MTFRYILVQSVFASYADRAVHFMELPGEIPNRQVHEPEFFSCPNIFVYLQFWMLQVKKIKDSKFFIVNVVN